MSTPEERLQDAIGLIDDDYIREAHVDENEAPAGASIFVDSSLVNCKVRRTDVNAYYIPATQISNDQGYQTLANMILMGHVIAKTGVIPQDMIAPAMKKVVSARHADLLDKNIEAVRLGIDYKEE